MNISRRIHIVQRAIQELLLYSIVTSPDFAVLLFSPITLKCQLTNTWC